MKFPMYTLGLMALAHKSTRESPPPGKPLGRTQSSGKKTSHGRILKNLETKKKKFQKTL